MSRSSPSPDEVQQALMLLHNRPYLRDESLDPFEQHRQEKACAVIVAALEGPLLGVCQRLGLDEADAEGVMLTALEKFLRESVGRVAPSADDARRWLHRACVNAALSKRRKAGRTVPLEAGHVMATNPVDDPNDEPARDVFVSASEKTARLRDWFGVRLPPGVSTELLLQGLAKLTPNDETLFLMLLDAIEDDRRASQDPRRFDRTLSPLAITRVAETLGRSPGSVSTSWKRVKRRFRRAIGELRAEELRADGQSVLTIRAALKRLAWDEREVDSYVATLAPISRRSRRGLQ